MDGLALKYGGPLYVYDGDLIVSNLHQLDKAIGSLFNTYQVFFRSQSKD